MRYFGEFKEGLRFGQGMLTYPDGKKYVGEFKDDKSNGRGITYRPDGTLSESGLYRDGQLYSSQYIDPNIFNKITRNSRPPSPLDSVFGQNNLPMCQGSDSSRWTYCLGTENYSNGKKYIGEFKDGLKHGQGTFTWPDNDKYVGEFKDDKISGQGVYTFSDGKKYAGEYRDEKRNGLFTVTYPGGEKFIGEYRDDKRNGRGIDYRANGSVKESGIYRDGELVTSQYIDPTTLTRLGKGNGGSVLSDAQRREAELAKAQLEQERLRLAEERRRFDEDKRQREQARQSSRVSITATATPPDAGGIVTITIQTNADTSSLKINGDELGGKTDGNYVVKRVARVGQETKFALVATDIYGNTDSKTITVVRQLADSKAVFGQLNAANIKQQPARDAVAIIIGIEKYKRVAKADYANTDAQDFYDYASRALGIKPENIKLLVDEGADDVEIYKAFQNWLPVKVRKGKTDVYVFYSGHGYPGQDGNALYILPYGADKDLIAKTAINQQEIVNALQNVQAKSVTMFLDSCYSGQTRGGDVLIAGARPIAPKATVNSYPPNFTVISASSNDQISSASPDLKHGIFSYYLMKGMEGDADLNKDGKITAAEMQDYLTDMVGRQAMGMNRKQQPQLVGDSERILMNR